MFAFDNLARSAHQRLVRGVAGGVLAGTVLAGAVIGPHAHADFPQRDIRMIVPWPAGGGADAISRKISSLAE